MTKRWTGWWVFMVCVMAFAVVDAASEEEVLPLPNWEQQEVQIFPLGGGLWPAGSAIPSQAEGKSQDELKLFIPNGATPNQGAVEKGEAEGRSMTSEEDLVEVGEDFFERHEGMAEGGFVYDPEMLLNDGARDDLSRMLASQAEGAKVAAHFVILGARQKLPLNVDLTRLAGANLVGGLSCMVVYPMGEPWRVRLFMSRRVTEVVKADYLRAMARACIQDALKADEGWEQLERFAIQLSIRLTWLEREHALPEVEVLSMEEAVEKVAEMPEVAMPEKAVEKVSKWELWWNMLRPWLWRSFGVVAGLVLLILACRWIWRRWIRRPRVAVWILPEVQVPPRLGGKHCGGGGASVQY
jgi:hypothetical protein